MDNLSQLRESLTKMLGLEARPRQGEWQHGISGREGVVSYDMDDVVFVAKFEDPTQEALAIEAVNHLRPLVTLALGLIAAVQGCETCNGSAIQMYVLIPGRSHVACQRCAPYRALLARLADEISK